MNARALQDARDRLLAPSAQELTCGLTEIGDGLAAAFADLARDARPDAAETLAARLHGAARHVMRLREAILRESRAPEAA